MQKGRSLIQIGMILAAVSLLFPACDGLGNGGTDDTTPPGEVSGIVIVNTGDRSVTFSWTDPDDADLAAIHIEDTVSDRITQISAGTQEATVTLTLNGVIHLLHFTAVDLAGNESETVVTSVWSFAFISSRLSYDENGTPTGTSNFVYVTDEYGMTTEMTRNDEDGNQQWREVYEIDANGHRTGMTRYKADDSFHSRLEYELDAQGLVIKNSCYDEADELLWYNVYTQNDWGDISRTDSFDAEGNLQSYTLYEYDSSKLRTGLVFYDVDNNQTGSRSHTRDDDGNLLLEEHFGEDGTLVWSHVYTYADRSACEAPVFSPTGGAFEDSVDLSLSTTTTGASIYYTLDGTAPDDTSTQYTEPVTLTETTLVKAVATLRGWTDSVVVQKQIFVVDPDVNMIVNGDFGQGEEFWRFDGVQGTATGNTCAYDANEAQITLDQTGDSVGSVALIPETTVSLVNETSYEVSFRAQSAAAVHLLFTISERSRDLNDNGSDQDHYIEESIDLTDDLTTYTMRFKLQNPSDDDAFVRFQLGDNPSGTVVIDDIILKRIELVGEPQLTLLNSAVNPAEQYLDVRLSTDNQYLFATTYNYVRIFDLTADPMTPDLVKSLYLPYEMRRLIVDGDVLLAGGNNYGASIDVSDPPNATITAETEAHGFGKIECITQSDEYFYAGIGSLFLVGNKDDAFEPDMEPIGGYWFDNTLRGMVVDGDYIYCAIDSGGLGILDISDLSSPQLVSTLSLNGKRCAGVGIHGNYAYCGMDDSEYGLRVVDISDPANPVEVEEINLSFGGVDNQRTRTIGVAYFEGTDTYSLGIVSPSGIFTLYLTDPTEPNIVSVLPCDDGNTATSYEKPDGNWNMFLAGFREGLQVLDTALHSEFQPAVACEEQPTLCLLPVGDYLYAGTQSADDYEGLRIFDITTPAEPAELTPYAVDGRVGWDGWVRALKRDGDHLYVGMNSYVCVLDISNRTSPSVVSSASVDGDVHDFAFIDGYVYAAAEDDGLAVIPRDTAGNLGTVVQMDLGDNDARNLLINGDYLYATTDQYLHVLDISDPSTPVIETSVDIGHNPEKLGLYNGNIVVTRDDKGFSIIDISDPTSPVVLSDAATPQNTDGLFIDGTWAYVGMTWGSAGLGVANLSDPDLPWLTSTYSVFNESGDRVYDIVGTDTHLYVAGETYGIAVFSR